MTEEKFEISLQKKDYASIFFFLLALLLGGYARLSQVLKSDFPLNDGGMFYQMTVDLQTNNYRLPLTTSYNGLDIPFVYPPLPFYIIGLSSDILGIELLDMYRVLPAVISVFTIPAFYFLAKDLLKNKGQIALAIICFALMPTTFDWLIMGGGITRALGFLSSIMTLQQTYRMYTLNKWKYVLGVGLFASLSVLSHPEAAVHTIAGVLVLFWFFSRQRRGIWFSAIVCVLVLSLTAPWWITVLQRHGLSPILAAGQTGWHRLEAFYQFWSFNFSNEIELSILGVSALVGVFWLLAKRDYFFPSWLLVTFAFEPRSAPLYITPILAMLAAIVLEQLFNTLLLRNRSAILFDNARAGGF